MARTPGARRRPGRSRHPRRDGRRRTSERAGGRTKAYRATQPKRGPETPDPARIAQADADAREASATRAATVAAAAAITAKHPAPTVDQAKQDAEDLAADAEALVRKYGLPTCIDAMCEAGHRLFKPATAEQIAKLSRKQHTA